MARVKNSSFGGTTVYDADIDAPTFTRVLKNVAADTALVYDRLTGKNGETTTINHGGTTGRGCRPGYMIINQCMDADCAMTNPGSTAAKGGAAGLTILAAAPFRQQGGETELLVEIDASGELYQYAPTATIISTAGAVLAQAPMFAPPGDVQLGAGVRVVADATTFSGRLTGLSGSGLAFLVVYVNTTKWASSTVTPPASIALTGLRLGPMRKGSTPTWNVDRQEAAVVGVTTPSATEMVAWRDLDASLFTDQMAYSAYLTAGINRNQNGLMEMLTGWPAHGNASYTHVDHDGAAVADATNPARSRFHAGTQSLEATEPVFAMPLQCEALGATMDNGYSVIDAYTPTLGWLRWYPPHHGSNKASTNVWRTVVAFPDFPNGGSSGLEWIVLISGTAITPGDWTAGISIGGGAYTGTSTLTQIGTSNLYYATGSALNFGPDVTARVDVTTQKTGVPAKGVWDECQIVGWYLGFNQ